MVRLTDRPDMTLDVYHGRKTTIQQQQPNSMGRTNCKKGITSLKRLPIQIKMTGYSSLFKRLSVWRTTFVITYVSLADEALPKFEKILLLLL